MRQRFGLPAVALALHCALVSAADPRNQLSDSQDGATCEYFNKAAGGAWLHKGGDFRDADGRVQGERPYASVVLPPDSTRLPISFDVTRLVAAWAAGSANPDAGLVLRRTGMNQGIAVLASREAPDVAHRPRLTLTLADGSRREMAPAADTFLDCTTEQGMGAAAFLKAGETHSALFRFDVAGGPDPAKVVKATLDLQLVKLYGAATLGVFAADPPPTPDAAPRQGLAAAYPGDAGIDRSADVWFAAGFEDFGWQLRWNDYDLRSHAEAVGEDPGKRFEPLSGRALRVRIPRGGNLGLDMRYAFASKPGGEPEEAYFRYYLRFADDWSPDVDGGKLPGFAGTYGRAGWGMRKSTGRDGWSMRGGFFVRAAQANPMRGSTAVGTYAYHAAIQESAGEPWFWPLGRIAALQNNRWYSIEQYFKVNTPGRSDGVLRAWIDGRLAVERTNIAVRDTDSIRIETVWMNVYHGGTLQAPRDMHLYIDNVVIARRYIGPMAPAAR